MFERFTRSARAAVAGACDAADRLGHPLVRPEHMLISVAAAEGEAGSRVLAQFGLDAATLERALTRRDPRDVLTGDEIAALRAVGIEAEEVFRRVEEAFGDNAWFTADPPAVHSRRHIFRRFEKTAADVLRQSLREAIALKQRRIGTEHILLALLADPQPPLSEVLSTHGVTYQEVRQRVG